MMSYFQRVICFALFGTGLLGLFTTDAAAQVSFDFEDGTLDGWTVVDELPENLDAGSGVGSWEVRDSQLGLDGKVLSQGSNSWGSAGDTMLMGPLLIFEGQQFTNFRLEMDVVAADNDGMGVVWGYTGLDSHNRIQMINDGWPSPALDGHQGPMIIAHSRISNSDPWYDLISVSKPDDGYIPYAESTLLRWTLEVEDGAFTFESDDGTDVNIITGTELTHTTGFVGIQLYAQSNIEFDNIVITELTEFTLNGGGETYSQDFDVMGTGRVIPRGWSGLTEEGVPRRAAGLGLTDGFLTVPGSSDDGVLGVVNVGGNESSFGPASVAGLVPTWTAELAGDAFAFGQDDAVADNATDRALGVSRENNSDAGELNFEIEISDSTLRAFVFDWDLEIWGGDPDADFRSPEGPGMKVDVTVGGTSYGTMTENLLPGTSFDTLEDDGNTIHNATLIDGNVYSVRGMSSGIKEVSDADGAVGNMVKLNFNSNWNDATDSDANGWISAVDNVRLRALAPGDADANGVVDVADLLQLLGGQKFNKGVDGVTWEQGDFNADDQFNTGDLLAMLSFLSGTFPSDPYASEAGGASDAVADIIVNSETGEVTVDLAGHTVSAIIIESASEIFNGQQPEWDTTSQFPSTLPGELGNVLFTSTASGTDELGAVISAEFLGRDKEFYLQDLDLNILIASEGGALTEGNVIVVPEPSTWMLLGLGSLLLVGWRQAKRSPGMN